MWLIPTIYVISFFSFNYYHLEKIDYLFSKRVENFRVEKFIDKTWRVSRIKIGNDEIYYSQNQNWGEIYDGKYKVYKSIFSNHYHLRKDE